MKCIYTLLLLFFCNYATAQSVAINTDGSTASTSALLDVKSTTKGLLLPRMTKAQKNAIASPATGLLVFQTGPDSVGFHYYAGAAWVWLGKPESNDWKTTGNTGTDTAVNFIGTTDNEPLRFKQNNIRMGQFDNSKANYFIGKGAGVRTTTSVGSVGIGDSALFLLNTGINNTAIGTNALNELTSGSNNTAIGYQADVNTSAINATAIGAFARPQHSNTMVLGSIAGENGATSNVEVGIGVSNPQARLHIRRAPSAATVSIAKTALTIEDSMNTIIHLINNDESPAYIISSNVSNIGRSVIEFSNDSAINFRTGSKSRTAPPDVTISKDRFLGIGTQYPQAIFHVSRGNSGNILTIPSNRLGLFEDDQSHYIQLLSPNGSESGILSGNVQTLIRGGIAFRPDSSLEFRTGGNTTRMVIKNDGKTGIATTTPKAFLDIDSTFKLGVRGTVNNALIRDTVNIDLPSMAADNEQTITIVLSGLTTNGAVSVSPAADLPAGISILWARVSTTSNVRIRFRNVSATTQDPHAMNFFVSVVQ